MRRWLIGLVAAAAAATPTAAALPTGAAAPDFVTTGAVGGKAFRLHLAELPAGIGAREERRDPVGVVVPACLLRRVSSWSPFFAAAIRSAAITMCSRRSVVSCLPAAGATSVVNATEMGRSARVIGPPRVGVEELVPSKRHLLTGLEARDDLALVALPLHVERLGDPRQ